MRRKRKTAPIRQNVTAHRRAMANSLLQQYAAVLRREWPRLGHVERGDHLRTLWEAGCSTRGLAEAVGISATTVRRYLEIASLPEDVQQHLANGGSAKRELALRAADRKRHSIIERLRVEKESGRFSDELANVVITFCKGEIASRVNITRDDLGTFLTIVAQRIVQLDAARTPRLRISKKLSLRQRLKRAKPKTPDSDMSLEQQAEWIARFVRATVPERAIWERAFNKATRRERELIRRVPLQDAARKVGTTTWIHIPPRPVTRPAREVMVRQGRKSKPTK